jgi:hypothetical protein
MVGYAKLRDARTNARFLKTFVVDATSKNLNPKGKLRGKNARGESGQSRKSLTSPTKSPTSTLI